MDILPPDKDIFYEKKQASSKQKEHLVKARIKAKETMERRKKAEELLHNPPAENIKVDIDNKDEESESDEEVVPTPPPLRKQKGSKKVVRTEEETELHRFEKFMKNMNSYEELKEQHLKDLEEKKKVKLSLPQDEYDYMLQLIEKDKLEKANPITPKASEGKPEQKERPVIMSLRNNRKPSARSRFG